METKENNILDESNCSYPLGARGSFLALTFEPCEFENPEHLLALATLLNGYMCDPMGDATPHNKLQQLRLVDGLANHPACMVLFVLQEGVFAGLATCFINFSTFNVKSYFNIHDFFIHPDYRGKGVANALMQELISIAIERKYGKITLEVRDDNRMAKGLYSSMGFEECDPKMLFWTKKI